MEGAQLVAKTKETKQLYFARAKKPLQIGVKAEYKQSELTYVSGKIWIDICIVDHKIVHVDEEFKFSSPGQYQLITSTAWRIKKIQPVEDLDSYSAKRPLKLLKKGLPQRRES